MTTNGSIQPRWAAADQQVAAGRQVLLAGRSGSGTGRRTNSTNRATRRRSRYRSEALRLGRAAEPGEALDRAASGGGERLGRDPGRRRARRGRVVRRGRLRRRVDVRPVVLVGASVVGVGHLVGVVASIVVDRGIRLGRARRRPTSRPPGRLGGSSGGCPRAGGARIRIASDGMMNSERHDLGRRDPEERPVVVRGTSRARTGRRRTR